jgi:hypothetical protein
VDSAPAPVTLPTAIAVSLLVEFITPTALIREQDRPSMLPIIRNGPPGTFVAFPDGLRVSLPTDQILSADDTHGFVRVVFGGMQFVGVEDGSVICRRASEVHPEHLLSPDRSHRMVLDPSWLSSVVESGIRVWPTDLSAGAASDQS